MTVMNERRSLHHSSHAYLARNRSSDKLGFVYYAFDMASVIAHEDRMAESKERLHLNTLLGAQV